MKPPPSIWEEFHHVFITECMYLLSDRLPSGYIAKIEERVNLITADDEAAKQYVPDVGVALSRRHGSTASGWHEPETAAVALAPVTIPSLDAIEVREGRKLNYPAPLHSSLAPADAAWAAEVARSAGAAVE